MILFTIQSRQLQVFSICPYNTGVRRSLYEVFLSNRGSVYDNNVAVCIKKEVVGEESMVTTSSK